MAPKLLIVEDEPALLDLMLEYCEEFGITGIAAETAAEALAKAAAEKPQAIAVDNRLPDMTGLDLITRLKNDQTTAAIPVLFVSADAKMHEAEARKRGAAYALNKPVRPDDLRAALEQCLGAW